jgi:hypothetical protein
MILTAPMGKRQDTIWGYACQIGGFVGGGEIRQAYALEQLQAAALNMQAGLCDKPERCAGTSSAACAMAACTRAPRPSCAASSRPGRPPRGAAKASPGRGGDRRARRPPALGAPGADAWRLYSWFRGCGLDPNALPGAFSRLRAVNRSPRFRRSGAADPAAGRAQRMGPIRRRRAGADAAEQRLADRASLGDHAGKAAFLTAWPEDGALLVALDLQDAWALGGNAHEKRPRAGRRAGADDQPRSPAARWATGSAGWIRPRCTRILRPALDGRGRAGGVPGGARRPAHPGAEEPPALRRHGAHKARG